MHIAFCTQKCFLQSTAVWALLVKITRFLYEYMKYEAKTTVSSGQTFKNIIVKSFSEKIIFSKTEKCGFFIQILLQQKAKVFFNKF